MTELVLNPDAHAGYGAPVGCVMVSPTHIYPGPVGVDIKCSMSLLQTNVHKDQIDDKRVRRALIEAICERTPTGAGKGQRSVQHGREISAELDRRFVWKGLLRRSVQHLAFHLSGRLVVKIVFTLVMIELRGTRASFREAL
ncbi:hypothetical protein GCM10020366_11380 [Saccharopolyspora gregorii]|uniref:3'-phosphate/5'-hydroxy nucleic acid ligase n=1 Tax=Saccharopolyspora gregorii TaxID=33914 RepID=A0ABP6RJI4_9PSEU